MSFSSNGALTSARLSTSLDECVVLGALCPRCLRSTSMELSVEDQDSRFEQQYCEGSVLCFRTRVLA